MNTSEVFIRLSEDLRNKLRFLDDKPEETIESTMKALWLAAAGIQVSAERALSFSLPGLDEKQLKKLHQLIELRLNNTPLAHITNRQNFMGIELVIDKRALIPRKETEILGKKALWLSNEISNSNGTIKVIDVCCGCGNLGIAIAHYNPDCYVYATDLSHEAVALTKENISLLQLDQRMEVKQGDLLSAFETGEYFEKIELIICNPPYILSSNVPKMHAEIASNEPALAFDGGMLGIKIIQKLIHEAPRYLTANGWLIFEVGAGQGDFIAKLCEKSGLFQKIEKVLDASGTTRVILVQTSR